MKLFGLGGQPLKSAPEVEVETAVVLYLNKNGGPTVFDVAVKFGNIKTTRQATLEDVQRMCYEVLSDVDSMKTSRALEKMMEVKRQIENGELTVKEGRLVAGPNAKQPNEVIEPIN